MNRKLLVITATDTMAWVLLRPWLTALQQAGLEVHIACPRGPYFTLLADHGFHPHEVSLKRRFSLFRHMLPLWQLYRLILESKFALVNTHGPVAAAVGRTAAWLARCPRIVYTVHGFYFHENMPRVERSLLVCIEWLLGRMTDCFMFVSEEDRNTAVRTGIASPGKLAVTISNGVNLALYRPGEPDDAETAALRSNVGIPPGRSVVGIVGRVVREKGYREFLAMAQSVVRAGADAGFLVIGDTMPSDRDQFGSAFRALVRQAGLADRFVFTGNVDDVPRYLRLMDIFVLPSYREGLPRSILEAMAMAIPVVATNIRGCREAVVQNETGLIVPPKDSTALAVAVSYLISHPEVARKMGAAGRNRACQVFDERQVQRRFVGTLQTMLSDQAAPDLTETCARS
jgi:glycosyltransferase involved in cell wall biosynthesis